MEGCRCARPRGPSDADPEGVSRTGRGERGVGVASDEGFERRLDLSRAARADGRCRGGWNRLSRMILLRCLTILLVVLAARPYRLAGAIRDANGKWQSVEIIKQVNGHTSYEIRLLDDATRREAFKTALGREVDPFPGKVDERHPGYLVFVLQVNNHATDEDLVFNPGQARMATNNEVREFALDYSSLYEVANKLGPKSPTLDELAGMIFDRTVTIRPGGSVRKLLVFEGPRDEEWKDLEVRLFEVHTGAAIIDVVFPFRKFPVEEEKKK